LEVRRRARSARAPARYRGVTADEQTYAFENAIPAQRDRLRTLEALLDADTIRHLEARGVDRGWQCLEVGAGGGSVATWLSARVAPEGKVVATDLDTTVLRDLSHPNLEVRVHDVLADDLPEDTFDLVHLRLLLAWLAEPETALQRLVGALKPGGWLVAEEMDFVSAVPDPRMDEEARALFVRIATAHNLVLVERHGFDVEYGRRVTGDLEDAGLAEVGCEGRATMWRGGQAGGRIWRHTVVQLRDSMIATGLVTAADVDAALALCDDPRLSSLSPVVMAAWGRRPAAS
jgi:SAM-dependent methyltransferase